MFTIFSLSRVIKNARSATKTKRAQRYLAEASFKGRAIRP